MAFSSCIDGGSTPWMNVDGSARWVAATADLASRPDPPRRGLGRPAVRGGTGEGMEDLYRSTSCGIGLHDKTPRGSSQPQDQDDTAFGENRA